MFRRFAKKLYFSGVRGSGAFGRRLRELQDKQKVAVLNLHRVSPEENAYWPPMRPDIFEQLLVFLTSHFEIRRISELKEPARDRPVAVLSFDDGYYDFAEYAAPLLKEYNVAANMNVIPECVVTGKPIWNVRLYDFLSATGRDRINRLKVPGINIHLRGESKREKILLGLGISRYLKNRPRNERQELWRSIEPHLEETEIKYTRMMSRDEILQLSEIVDFGAHSYSHESMGFEDDEFFESDLERCRNYFLNELSMPLRAYAFPNGSYKPEQVEFLRRSGIEHILLVDEAFADLGSDVLPRITMYGESAGEVAMRALRF